MSNAGQAACVQPGRQDSLLVACRVLQCIVGFLLARLPQRAPGLTYNCLITEGHSHANVR